MYRMLYGERNAYVRMPRAWRPAHLALRRAYWPLSRFAIVRRLWRTYRKTWPS